MIACAPATPTPAPQVISVYASSSTQTWLAEAYDCAAQQSVVIRLSDSPSVADIRLRLGEPDQLNALIYPIDSEEILIVTHRESPIQNLSADEARALFAQGRADVQIWVFASSEDDQQIFEREMMRGTPITSLARLAVNPQEMSDTLNAEKNAVGILPAHWKMGAARIVYTLPSVPVLAIVKNEPQGAIKELLACLQK
jgi:hypothetical protein